MVSAIASEAVTGNIQSAENSWDNELEEAPIASTHDGSPRDCQETCSDEVTDAFAHLYLRLLSERHVPSSTVQLIAEAIYDIQTANVSMMTSILKARLKHVVCSEEVDKIIDEAFEADLVLAVHRDPGGVFRSKHTRNLHFKKRFLFVEPVTILLGRNKRNRDATFYYVPVLKTLEAMLENEAVVKQCDELLPNTNRVMKDFTDGSVFKSILLYKDHPKALKLILFQDAFEVVNPLGSAKKKHKLLAVYLILGNLYSWKRCSTDSIKLCLLCSETYFKYFGQDKIFAPLIDDLKKLEAGTVVTTKGTRLIGTVCAILGDNLGSHGIGGFVENFSNATHICRFCLAERRDLFSPLALSGVFELRTPDNYNSAVLTLAADSSLSAEKGVKFRSLFNDLKYFDVCAPGLPPCLAHDLFEGIVSFDLSLYIQYFVTVCEWISLEDLNNRIGGFPFKRSDLNDRPCEVPVKKSLGGHAIQNWNMVRFLPLFLVGSVQSTENEVWKQVLLLSEIVLLVTAPAVTSAMAMRLQDIIEDYMTSRAALFPNIPLRPKHHYLLHYPMLIMQFGPLIRLWTMRCESKHSYFKKCARNCQNFKNLTLTLSQRHQLFQAYKNTGSSTDVLDNASTFMISLCSPEIQNEVREVVSDEGEIFSTQQATIRGLLYECKMLVVMSRQNGELKFGEIQLILSKDARHFFLVKTVSTSYEPGMQYFNILSNDGPIKCIELDSLLDNTPLIQYNLARCSYPVFVLKHGLLDGV